MPVQTEHREYIEYKDVWYRCRVAASSQRQVKAEKTAFLPKLSGQDDDQYERYLRRASYFNATGRTVDGLVGIVFRKEPDITNFPESKSSWLERVGHQGSPLEAFAKRVFRNTITVGRHGVLLDLEEEGAELPYFSSYTAESIINWEVEFVNGLFQLSLVVLEEFQDEPKPGDDFEKKHVRFLRVLKLVPRANIEQGLLQGSTTGIGGVTNYVYMVELYKEKEKSTGEQEKFQLVDTYIPKVRGMSIPYIPFVFFGPVEPSAVIQKPLIEDLADVNISHYMSSADLEHGRHFTALPTPWVAGFKTDTHLQIGSETAWVSENPDAQAGMLEYTGQGLQALEKALEQKEAQMAILGARMLEAPKSAVEAGNTLRQRQAGEQSVLASAAGAVESGFTILLNWVAQWFGFPVDTPARQPIVTFNKDYMAIEMDPQMVQTLFALLQGNRMSWDTFAYNLQRGELYPEGRTPEEELELIEKEMDKLPTGPSMDLEEDDEEDEEDEEEEDDESGTNN